MIIYNYLEISYDDDIGYNKRIHDKPSRAREEGFEDICTFVESSALHTSFSNCNWKPILQLLKVHKLTKEAVCLKYLKTNNGLLPFQKWM